jgi:hypothetical protein
MASQARDAHRIPGTTAAALYRALGDMIALDTQRSIRRRKIRTAEPRLCEVRARRSRTADRRGICVAAAALNSPSSCLLPPARRAVSRWRPGC